MNRNALVAHLLSLERKMEDGGFFYLFRKYHEEVKQFMATKHKEYWLDRIDAVLLPDQASERATYHMKQSVKAIGSGSLEGDGYLHGTSALDLFDYLSHNFIGSQTSIMIINLAGDDPLIGCSLLLQLRKLLTNGVFTSYDGEV